MGSEEGRPPLTGLTLVQVVRENYFCLRTDLPFSTEILIQVNFKGVAGWHKYNGAVFMEPMAFGESKDKG